VNFETGYAVFVAGAGIGLAVLGIAVAIAVLVNAYRELSE